MRELSDIELMLRVRESDVGAFRELVGRYREPLARFFYVVLADRSLVDDCVQETLLRLWSSRARYEPAGSFSAYLFQIGRHYWLNQRKKVSTDLSRAALHDPELWLEDGQSGPEAEALNADRARRIRRAVAELPERQRAVFELCHFEGLKYGEIAATLGIPEGTVKSRMSEALRRLRRTLDLDEEGA